MKQIAFILAILAGQAQADIVLPNGRVIDCFCTDTQGSRVELGQTICLFVDGRAFMALCDMSLNVPIWRDTGGACETSALDRLRALKPIADTSGIDAHI